MLFSSLDFLYIFLPITVILYFLSPKKLKNGTLLIASLVFYAAGEPIYLFLMIFCIAMNYAFGFLCDKEGHSPRFCKTALLLAIASNVAILFFFKYFDFFAEPLPFLSPLGIALPLGISFYTFQALSYVADVYMGKTRPARSFLNFSAYVSLFPQLVAGPIVRYSDIDGALTNRTHGFSRCAEGIRRFAAGLAKKVLLANPAGEMFSRMMLLGESENTAFGAWLGIIFYAFQIYFDFSGYSDMAIGLGKIFGFDFPENFNYPYISRSVGEFWRRWHITLSSFFKEYVYIPLGGNRRGAARTYLNLLVVWSLTGLWHGAAPNFLLWGLYYFALLTLEKAILGRLLEKAPRILGHLYSIAAIVFGWVIFAADTMKGGAFSYFLRMLGVGAATFFGGSDAYELTRNAILLSIMTLAATPLPKRVFGRLFKTESSRALAENVLSLASFFLCTARLVSSGYNPFLYFRF